MSGPDANGWMPIESAPKDGTRILIGDFKEADPDEHDYGIAEFVQTKWQGIGQPDWYWSLNGTFAPTHWQPLPLPPVSP